MKSKSINGINTGLISSTTILAKFGFQTAVTVLVLACYIYIINFAIIPWIETTQFKGRVNALAASILTILVLLNYYLSSTTDPGSYRDSLSPKYPLGNHTISFEESDKRFCSKCQTLKPDRSHHCRYCNSCILKLDHHCPWIQNCVGLMNQKFFVLFLFYGTISIVYFFGLLISRTMDLIEKHANEATLPEFNITQLILLGILIIVLIIACISILSLLSTQIWLISKNLTTIEWEDTKRKGVSISYYKKYDKQSLIQNFSQVFGPLSIYWLLPTTPSNLRFDKKKGDSTFIV